LQAYLIRSVQYYASTSKTSRFHMMPWIFRPS